MSTIRSFIWYCSVAIVLFTGQATRANDIETIRKRLVSELLTPPTDPARVKELVSTIRSDGTWPGIDYKDVSRTAFEHGQHLNNLVTLSRAYVRKGSPYRKNKALKNAIRSGLNYWLANDFICENWWWNEIGTPNLLMQVLLIMDQELDKEQVNQTLHIVGRAHLDAWGARPGGDRIKIGGIQAKRAIYNRDADMFGYVIKVIESEIKFATGRGMQYDYSFHHREDRVNNTLSYGLGYADAFAEWAANVSGTKYSFSQPALRLLIDYYLDGICKMMVYARYPDPGAMNRDITRPGAQRIFPATTPERLAGVTDYRKDELTQVIRSRKEQIQWTTSFGVFFWESEYYTHQRPDYFTSVRMYSERNRNMEVPYNGEGLANHYRGDGTNYISLTGTEYSDISPVYDWQKIPGATILQRPSILPESDVQKSGTMNFTGAVTDGIYGAVAFDFRSPHDPVEAKKAWFFFDREYVCLGSGIKTVSRYTVATTLNQCLLNGDVVIGAGQERTIDRGSHQLDQVQWVYHGGVGYLFPEPARINLSNQTESGSWFLVNRQSDTPRDEVRLDVFKLWIDHGARVSNGEQQYVVADNEQYQYIVMPAAGKDDVAAYSKNPEVKILSNTTGIQAVRHTGLNIFQVVCYKNGTVQLTDDLQISFDSPGIIMLRTEGSDIKEISVSDPSRKLGKLHFTVNRKIEKQDENFRSSWDSSTGTSEIVVKLPQTVYAGKSVTIKI